MPTRVGKLIAAPLTPIWQSGFEMGTLLGDGFISSAGSVVATTTEYHKSLNEILGAASDPGRAQRTTGLTTKTMRVLGIREFVFGYALRHTSPTNQIYVYFQNSAAQTLVQPRIFPSYEVSLRRNNTTVASSASGAFDASLAYRYGIFHAYVADSNGFMHFYDTNFDLAHRIATFNGDTTDYTSDSTLNRLYIESEFYGSWWLDDLVVYARTLFYSGFSGTAVAVGQTVTDGTSGATATIDAVETDGANGGGQSQVSEHKQRRDAGLAAVQQMVHRPVRNADGNQAQRKQAVGHGGLHRGKRSQKQKKERQQGQSHRPGGWGLEDFLGCGRQKGTPRQGPKKRYFLPKTGFFVQKAHDPRRFHAAQQGFENGFAAVRLVL
jgi:hypothetical protein